MLKRETTLELIMTLRVAVGDIMTRHFISVTPETDLLTCSKEIVKHRVDSIVVAKNKRLLGIITPRDILWAIIKKPGLDLKQVLVSDISTKKVAVIKPSADISQALKRMRQVGFRRLPVLSRGELVGLVTLKDILRVDPGLYTELGKLADIREESRKLKMMSKLQNDSSAEFDGLCEECGALSNLLNVENRMLCQDCREELY